MKKDRPWRWSAAAIVISLGGCDGPPAGVTRKDPPSLVKLGDDLQKAGDTEGALTMFRAASASGGRNGTAFERVGEASAATGDPVRAEQAFRAAMQSGDATAATKRGLAIALMAQDRPGEALPLLASLPDPDARTLRAYGVALDMTGRQAEAQAAYRRGLALSPADPDLHGNLALSLAASGEMEAALSEIRAAIYAPVADPRQEVNQVLLLAVAGRDGEARERGLASLGAARTAVVLQQAERVRAAPDAAGRARIFGILAEPPAATAAPAVPAVAAPGPPPPAAGRAGG